MNISGQIIWSSVKTWFYIYAFWMLFCDLSSNILPYSLFGTIFVYVAIQFAKLPPPKDSIVHEILGKSLKEIENENEIDKSSSYCMKVVAHRGACLDAPENSLTAFKLAHEKKCTAIEFDLVFTADNVPVIFHDSTVDRITHGTGRIEDFLWEDLKKLDISAKHPLKEKFQTERIAAFEETIQECLKMDMRMFIDIKGDDIKFTSGYKVESKSKSVILDAFKQHPLLYKRAIVSSFNPISIYLIRRANPDIVCSLAWRPNFFSYESYSGVTGVQGPRYKNLFKHMGAQVLDVVYQWLLEHVVYYLLGLSAILLHKDITSLDVVKRWENQGVRVLVFPVNLPTEKYFFSRILKIGYMTDTLADFSDGLQPLPQHTS